MTRPPMSLSHSSMLALHCPYRFWSRYILATTREPSSIPAWCGTLAHLIIAKYISALALEGKRRDMELLIDIGNSVLEAEPEYIQDKVQRALSPFMGFRINRKASAHHTERLLAVDRDYNPIEVDWDSATHRVVNPSVDCITGQLDYIAEFANRAEIWDWKTGEEHVEPGDARGNPQLVLYAALTFAHFPDLRYLDAVLYGIKYGESNKDSCRFRREDVLERAKKRSEKAFTKLDILWNNLGVDGAWPAMPISLSNCTYCTAALDCPLNAEMLAGPIPAPPPRRKSLAQYMKEMESG